MKFTINRKDKKMYEQFTTRFEVELMEKLRQEAEKNNVSINSLINDCVRFALQNME